VKDKHSKASARRLFRENISDSDGKSCMTYTKEQPLSKFNLPVKYLKKPSRVKLIRKEEMPEDHGLMTPQVKCSQEI